MKPLQKDFMVFSRSVTEKNIREFTMPCMLVAELDDCKAAADNHDAVVWEVDHTGDNENFGQIVSAKIVYPI